MKLWGPRRSTLLILHINSIQRDHMTFTKPTAVCRIIKRRTRVSCLSDMFATTAHLRKESEMSHVIVIYKIKYCAFKHKQTYFKN